VLAGQASWDDVDGALAEHPVFLARFAAEQPVQTNEIGRAAPLARGIAALGRREVDLLELGTAGGLLLYVDRFVEAPFRVVRRRGIDLNPVDVTTEEGARLLEAFVWPDQRERIERLRRAIEVARQDPPELIDGDYVDVVSSHVQGETVVMTSVTTGYLDDDRYEELVAKLQGVDWVSLAGPRHDHEYEGMQLVVNGRVLEEHLDYHDG
jgi:hypothetical protein